MKMKNFTSIEESISAIGLGTWQFSGKDSWDSFDEAEAIKIIHAAVDSNINFIDTAPVYGLGHSEILVGKAIKGLRDKIFLASKVGLPWDKDFNVRNDLTRKSIEREIDDSLKRLQTDHIDLYQIHWPDPNTPIEETMEALKDIQKSGKIRYIGVSNFSLELLKRAQAVTNIASHQGLYNMFEPNAGSYHNIPLGYKVQDELLPKLVEQGMFFLPYSPLLQGLLAGKTDFSTGVCASNPVLNNDRTADLIALAQRIEKECGKPINEIAINWLINQDGVGPIIAGVSNRAQLSSNLNALEWSYAEVADQVEALLKSHR